MVIDKLQRTTVRFYLDGREWDKPVGEIDIEAPYDVDPDVPLLIRFEPQGRYLGPPPALVRLRLPIEEARRLAEGILAELQEQAEWEKEKGDANG